MDRIDEGFNDFMRGKKWGEAASYFGAEVSLYVQALNDDKQSELILKTLRATFRSLKKKQPRRGKSTSVIPFPKLKK